MQEEQLFHQALEQPEDRRASFLDAACGGDADLRERVEVLLRAHENPGSFLGSPAHGVGMSPTLDQPITEKPGAVIGRYKLLEEIGEGGMGVVYMAEQREPVRRKVALKIIKPGMDTREVIARFEAERQAMAMMDHPNIARILDGGATESGRPYFVMERVQGMPITDYCDRANLTTRQRLDLFVLVCQAVQHAHQKGIIHRDVKPSNVLVTLHDGVPVPKIIDFGIAKAIHQQLTEKTLFTGHGRMLGTPMYMSPEQAEMSGLDVDTRSDIYSLGVLLYEMLTGSTPFDPGRLREAGIDEVRRVIREEEPPRPSHRVCTLDAEAMSTITAHRGVDARRLGRLLRGDLDWIVMKALEKDRTRRYESASALAADVERHLANEPIEARPPTLADRAAKWARRHRAAVWSALAFLALSTIGLAASTLLIAREQTRTADAYQGEKEQRELADEQKLIAQEQERIAREQERLAVRQQQLADRQKAEAVRQRDAARQNLYYADMRLAFVDIGLGNAGRARDNLLNHVPAKDQPDHRGWEWYHLLGRSHEAEQALYGHGSEVSNVAWSSNGNSIASVSYDGSARVWDTKTWKLVRSFDHGETLKCCVAWSPDSGRLAWGSAADENALRIWDRQPDTISILLGHQSSIWAVQWSHDGRYVATAGINSPGNVRIWNVGEKRCIREMASTGHNVRSIVWSPNDRLLAATCPLSGLLVWNVSSGETVCRETQLKASCVSWHPSEARLAVGRYDGECLIWDQAGRKTVLRWKAHRGEVRDIAWAADGRRLLSAGHDGIVKVWDTEGREHKSVAAHEGLAMSVAWDPTGKRFASSGSDGVIRIWSAENRPNPLVVSTKLKGDFNLAWDNQSTCLFLASAGDGKIVAWHASSGKRLEEIPLRLDENRRLVSFRYLVERSGPAAAGPAPLNVTDVPPSGILAKVVASSVLNNGCLDNEAILSPDGARIAYMSGYTPTIRHLPSGRTLQCPDVVRPVGGAWSPDGSRLAVVGCGEPSDSGTPKYAGWVHIFDADSGKRFRKLQIGTERVAGTAVAWTHDGRKIAVGNELGLCEVWEVMSGRKLLSTRIHPSQVNDLAWSLDDLRLASGGINGQVHIWDSATGQELLSLEPDSAPIRHIRWSPDGRKLAAVSDDGVIKVWDATAGYELPRRDFWRHLIKPRQWKEYWRLIDEQRWSQAADLLKGLIAAGGRNVNPMYQLALVNLQLDDQAGYREACNRILSTFADTEENEAWWTAWACALAPDATKDWPKAVALAEKAVKSDPKSQSYLNTLGAILYRAGRFDEAVQRLTEADRLVKEPSAAAPSAPAYTWFFLAMAHQRLRHREEAKKWLDKAVTWTEKTIRDADQGTADLPWNRRLTLKLLREEAEAVLGIDKKPPAGKEKAEGKG